MLAIASREGLSKDISPGANEPLADVIDRSGSSLSLAQEGARGKDREFARSKTCLSLCCSRVASTQLTPSFGGIGVTNFAKLTSAIKISDENRGAG